MPRRTVALLDDPRGVVTAEHTVLFVVIAVATLTGWVVFGHALASLFGDDDTTSQSTSRSPSSSSSPQGTGSPRLDLGSVPSSLGDSSSGSRAPSTGTASGSATPGGNDRSLFDPPALGKKHVKTTKPDADDGGTYDLWLTCQEGDAQACANLRRANDAQLQEALSFIQRVAPDLYDPKNPPKFQWDDSKDFFDNNDGSTKGNTITLSRGYYSQQLLVNTVAHELQHAQQGRMDVWLTWGQDKANEIFGNGQNGDKHQAIFDRARGIEDKWAEEHP